MYLLTKQLFEQAAKKVEQVNCLGSVEKSLQELLPCYEFLSGFKRHKLLIIGDPHGDKVEFGPSLYDYVILMGDYMDSFHNTDAEILDSFMYYIQQAKDNSNVILLLGNHDNHYYHSADRFSQRYGCSGYRPSIGMICHHLFQANKTLFKPAFQLDNFLFTHAGISGGFYKHYLKNFNIPDEELADELSRMYYAGHDSLFYISRYREGMGKYGGPFWADKFETEKDPLKNFTQVVGHTPVKRLEITEGFIYTDTKTHKHEIDLWKEK